MTGVILVTLIGVAVGFAIGSEFIRRPPRRRTDSPPIA